MLTFVLLVVLFVHGFWIWLLLGAVLALLGWRSRGARRGMLLGTATLSGLVGGIGGCVAVSTVSTQTSFESEASRYFAQACASQARVQLPDPPLAPQLAVRWVRDRADAKPLLARRQLSALSGTGPGQYHAVETVGEYSPEFDVTIDGEHQPLGRSRRPDPLPEGLVRYSVRNRETTTDEDRSHFVESFETVITDLRDGAVVARRVVLGRSSRQPSVLPPFVCPGPAAVPAGGCDEQRCDIEGFLLAAVPPAQAASR